MKEYYLKCEQSFWTKGGRKTIYPAGTMFFVELETLATKRQPHIEFKNYYVYEKPGVVLGFYDEEEFNEIFMTKEEARDKKIDEII